MQAPLVSIVMPSFNQARFIEAAIESVLQQSWPHLELIVQDGGSSDGTLAILKRVGQQDSRLRWRTAADRGPADALNQALGRVRGTLVGWLNSDDLYAPGAIQRAVAAFQHQPAWMLCYGEGEHIDVEGRPLGRYPTQPTPEQGATVPAKQAFQRGCFICQPTVFFKAVMPRLLGKLDENVGVAFDFDYWLRAFNAFPERIGYLPELQAYTRLHDDTITRSQRRRVALEGMQVLARHQGSAPGHWVLSYRKEQREQGVAPAELTADLQQLLQEVRPLMQPHAWHTLKQQL
ncbi:MAG: glycosyltransferase family 2 protein [Pseudomonadota bacterium]